ncbi:MAG TPA: hypothetical protein VG448_08175 [Solirubrobacterales bacterium]|nr:hypothetical protein [Solirubrobacterales bacterium]
MEALKMETPMTEWNNDRLDEMNGRMKEGFAEVDKRFEQVDKRFEKVDERFVRLEGEMKEGFAKAASKDEMRELRLEMRGLNERFDRLLHAMAVSAVGFAGAVLATLAGIAVL